MNIEYPEKYHPLFFDWQKYNYAVLYGGRGSGKSETVARYVITRCLQSEIKVLCTRESEKSMDASIHSLLSSIIAMYGLSPLFEIQEKKIICKKTGSTIIFRGLRQEAGHIRSMHDIDLVWIEEGQYVGQAGFTSLDDTIRKEGSLILICLNPRNASDYLYDEFVKQDRPEVLKININILENPFATEVSKDKARRLRERNYKAYKHIYLGELEEGGETIGAFQKVDKFTAEYLVAFIDTSFSDANDSDKTSLSIVGFSINDYDDVKQCPIEFTGISWQKSVTNPDVIREMLLFLDKYKPIETCVESNLGGKGLAANIIDGFKSMENILNLRIKNHWTTFHQSGIKHERIMDKVGANKTRIFVLKDTEPEYLNPIIGYTKRNKHEDEIDSLAGAINLWLTSDNLKNYIYQYEQLKKQRAI